MVRDAVGNWAIPPPGSVGVLPGPFVYDATSARRIPAVARCIQLYGGLCKQMPMDAYKGFQRINPTPRLCQRPDPMRAGSWFVENSVVDYLLNGNAISLITSRGFDGWPLSVTWLSAAWVYINWNVGFGAENDVDYYYLGQKLNFDDVIHVRRGADRDYPVRGVGVVEEAMGTLDRAAMEEVYEASTLAGAAVPSVAIITPQAVLTQQVAEDAKASWNEKFAGPVREPAILPSGTQVIPLAWSPTDTQLIEARRLSLVDVANFFNIDSYWVGAPVAGMTYRTAQPQYQQVLRTSLEPVLADFEDVWSNAWLPRGTAMRFRRSQLLREDLQNSTQAAVAAFGAGIATLPEARVMLGLPPNMPGAIGTNADQVGPAEGLDGPETMSPDDTNPSLPQGEPGGGNQP
jgi:HK97 family phage portal protein